MRQTRSKTGKRRSHHALKTPALAVCSNCGANHRPHHMCLECGFYNGRQVMDLKKRKEEREARLQAKRERIKAEQEAVTSSEAAAVSEAEPTETQTDTK